VPAASRATRKLHLHIENLRRRSVVSHIQPEDYQRAARRHAQLAKRIKVTFGWDGDKLEEALQTAHIVVGVPENRARLRERAPRLKWIHSSLAGVDRVLPFDWLPRGVVFTNNRGVHGHKAEQYMRMAYTMMHTRMPEILRNQRAHLWRQEFSPTIAGRCALVIGLGDLGEAAARAARQLELTVIGVRRTAKACRHADKVYTFRALDRLLPRADFVVLAVPLTPATRNLLSRERLQLLKPECCVINIARAQVMDYAALAAQLRAGKIAGAMVDVLEPEPLPAESELWDAPNLIITPHISCDDFGNYAQLTLDLVFDNLARLLRNRPLRNRVNRKLGY
jgi:phosphoglycerate dehydrogenase-like enzyme